MQLTISPDDGFLRVHVSGHLSLADANAAFVEMLAAVEQHGSTRVLVDCQDLHDAFDTLEGFDHAAFGAELLRDSWSSGALHGVRFGYLVSEADAEQAKFGENVAVNRGMNVKTFTRLEDAVRWLTSHPTHSASLRQE